MTNPTPVVFIPALLCDEILYHGVIAALGDTIEAHVMISPKPSFADSVSDDLPHAHFHSLPDCGHLPTLEKPAESTALFADFLADEPHHHHHH